VRLRGLRRRGGVDPGHAAPAAGVLHLALAQRGPASAETLPGEKIQQRIEARVGRGQAHRHHHGLLHGQLLRARGALARQEAQVHGALHVVRQEAHQEGHQHDDDHPDGPGAHAPLSPGGVVARQQGADDPGVADQDDQEGQGEARRHGDVVNRDQFEQTLPVDARRLEAFDFPRDGVGFLAAHEERRVGETDERPDAHAHQAGAGHRRQPQVQHGENDGQEARDGHGDQEVDAAVEVDVEGVGADAAQEVALLPLALVDVVEDSERQRHDEQQVGHGQVHHVHVEGRALAVRSDQHRQGEAVAQQAQHRDDGVGRGVDVATELVDVLGGTFVSPHVARQIGLHGRSLCKEEEGMWAKERNINCENTSVVTLILLTREELRNSC